MNGDGWSKENVCLPMQGYNFSNSQMKNQIKKEILHCMSSCPPFPNSILILNPMADHLQCTTLPLCLNLQGISPNFMTHPAPFSQWTPSSKLYSSPFPILPCQPSPQYLETYFSLGSLVATSTKDSEILLTKQSTTTTFS